MTASPQVSPHPKKPERILILGEDLLHLARVFENFRTARILLIRDRHSLGADELRHFNPDVVVCSGDYFRRVLAIPPTGSSKFDAPRLSARRRDLLGLIVKGLSNREIADVAGVSQRVVKGEVSALLLLFEVSNRTELATCAPQFESAL